MIWSSPTRWVIAVVVLCSMAPLLVTRARNATYPTSRCQPVMTVADSVVLLSRDSYCRGGNPELTVTGTNVRWYADAAENRLTE